MGVPYTRRSADGIAAQPGKIQLMIKRKLARMQQHEADFVERTS